MFSLVFLTKNSCNFHYISESEMLLIYYFLQNINVALIKFLMGYGAPEKSRTPNLQIRSLALYPIELRALYKIK